MVKTKRTLRRATVRLDATASTGAGASAGILGRARRASALLALIVPALLGCATRVPIEAQRTPTLNTADVQRIAVMPFDPGISTPGHQNVANIITSEVRARLAATGAFDMVDDQMVSAAIARGDDLTGYVDAMLVGRVVRYSSGIVTRSIAQTLLREIADQQAAAIGNPIARRVAEIAAAALFPEWRLEIEVSFEYSIVMARDGTMFGPVGRTASLSRGNDNPAALPAPATLISGLIENQLDLFYRDVVPHTVSVRVVLEREEDSGLRAQMQAALAQVRAGEYLAALESYIAIWEEYGSISAAINAATLFHAIGELEAAIYFIYVVAAATGSPRADDALARLNSEMEEMLGLLAFDDDRTPQERVAEHAIAEVRRVLPGDARVWIHNNATANLGLVNDVIDSMASEFIGLGVPVVEREFISLIAAEQDLHLEGFVNDSDFMSIGNLAGANTIVTVGITGAGAARRLQVRVLDIATATVMMQSGTGAFWSL